MMKTGVLLGSIIFASAWFASCGQPAPKTTSDKIEDTVTVNSIDSTQLAVITFKEEKFDFGKIKDGDIIDHSFEFTNTGDSPLILTNINVSCGCTQPEFSKTPIKPGETSQIKVTYKSEGQVGKQQKLITVQSNAANALATVQLTGEVLPKK